MKQRLAQLEKQRTELLEGESLEIEHDGIKIVDNIENNRTQIFFDGKPDAETRKDLKGKGFRWARSLGAWQGHRSPRALWLAKEIVGVPESTKRYSVSNPQTKTNLTKKTLKRYSIGPIQ